MSHYEERLEKDLAQIQIQLTDIGTKVEKALQNSVDALLKQDQALANQTIIEDNPINRQFEKINQKCYSFVARHLPSAGHLRRISSILRFNLELERIGDYAVTISRETNQFSRPLSKIMVRNVELMQEEALDILHQSVTAFIEDNTELARGTIEVSKRTGRIFSNAFTDLSEEENREDWSLDDLYGVLAIYASLARVSDLSKNICEETIFVVTGKTKIRKPVEVLFVDEGEGGLSSMAQAIAKKTFPRHGRYTSASRNPVANFDSEFSSFLDRSGVQLPGVPKPIDSLLHLDDFQVIVSLEGKVKSYFERIAFHTAFFEWDVASLENREQQYKEISHQIHELMEIMRGKDGP
ncbi:MAG: phosphate signaling complex protein PhoU [SAR324 cluster bacterium]|nr:phosphate signaling complex protein PhoU [SAR324 cluster bacterium]